MKIIILGAGQVGGTLAENLAGDLITNLAGSGSVLSVSDTNVSSRRFYRVGVK